MACCCRCRPKTHLEQWVLEILAELGWTPVHGPDIAPGEPAPSVATTASRCWRAG